MSELIKATMQSVLDVHPTKINLTPTMGQINREKGVHSWSPRKMEQSGTPMLQKISREAIETFLPHLQKNYPERHPVIDARVQRLMPGMYPSIPGWHCDACPRSDYHSQPDLNHGLGDEMAHVVCTFSTEQDGVSNTQFLTSDLELEVDPSQKVWSQVHDQIQRVQPPIYELPDQTWALMNFNTVHAASPAKIRGARIFFRLSMMPNLAKDSDERSAEQVYILSEANGW